jgi:hypothetical protein
VGQVSRALHGDDILTPLLTEVANDLSTSVLSPCLLVVHDPCRGGEHHEAERPGRKKLVDPVLDLAKRHVESWRDDTALVDAAVELHDDLAGSVVVDLLEFPNVACRWRRSAKR